MEKYTDEQLDSFLNVMNVELLPYQRKFVEKCLESDGKVYITMPPRVGFGEYGYLREMLSVVLGEHKEGNTND